MLSFTTLWQNLVRTASTDCNQRCGSLAFNLPVSIQTGLAQGTGSGGLQEAGVQGGSGHPAEEWGKASQVCPSGAILGTSHCPRVTPLSNILISALRSLLFLPCQGPQLQNQSCWGCPNCKKNRVWIQGQTSRPGPSRGINWSRVGEVEPYLWWEILGSSE